MKAKRRPLTDFFDLPGRVRGWIKRTEKELRHDNIHMVEGISRKCPWDKEANRTHDFYYRYTAYAGVVLMDCRSCGFLLRKSTFTREKQYNIKRGEEE
jgi:hypothetical protein